MGNHASNDRIKRLYLIYLKEANRRCQETIDRVASAITRFEIHNEGRSFKTFRSNQAIAFKKYLAASVNPRTKRPLSKSTLCTALGYLRSFFQWLAGQPGFKSRICYADAQYFNLSENDINIAHARREPPFPTVEQLRRVLATMPTATELERRDRALVAFVFLTGIRAAALASLKLKHVDLDHACVHQDARDVSTKSRKTFETFFFGNVGTDVLQIVEEWIRYLRAEKGWGHDDPVFPATATAQDAVGNFVPVGLMRKHWHHTEPIRRIFAVAFTAAGLPYFNPHSIRRTLVALAQAVCQTPEEFKAVSQNLGHNEPLTEFTVLSSYRRARRATRQRPRSWPRRPTAPSP
jgi:integrase